MFAFVVKSGGDEANVAPPLWRYVAPTMYRIEDE
jgi:hypothetical protein